MTEPETRHLLSVTHCQIRKGLFGAGPQRVARNPFLKAALLKHVFADSRRLETLAEIAAESDAGRRLPEAVGRYLRGGSFKALAMELASIDGDSLVRAAGLALDRERAARGSVIVEMEKLGRRRAAAESVASWRRAFESRLARVRNGLLDVFSRFDLLPPDSAPPQSFSSIIEFARNRNRRFDDAIASARRILEHVAKLMAVEPVGYLQLERLEFTPVDYVTGELVYSLPMAAGETVRLNHREWSRVETEFERLIQTSYETASEEEVRESTELSDSTETEQSHSSTFQTTASASGGFPGFFSASATVSYGANDAAKEMAKQASKRTRETTNKASSRSKREQKITFRVTREEIVEDESSREIVNAKDYPVRYDYHRLMKQWRVDLRRSGLRLTYDLVIPEPAEYLLRKFARLQELTAEVNTPIDLGITPNDIKEENYVALAGAHGVLLNAPPKARNEQYVKVVEFATRAVVKGFLEIKIPDGYEVGPDLYYLEAKGSEITVQKENPSYPDDYFARLLPMFDQNFSRIMPTMTSYFWEYVADWSEEHKPKEGTTMTLSVQIPISPTAAARQAWQMECYDKLVNAAEERRQIEKDRMEQQIAALREELFELEPFELRRIERDEIMKSVLRWLLGDDFDFYPRTGSTIAELLQHVVTPIPLGSHDAGWRDVWLEHGEIIRFLHQAVEWENINYVLYPYFWSAPSRWDFKHGLRHPDYRYQNFLRAGAARVVLSIRVGYEQAFLSFMETVKLDELLADDDPYMTIAEELSLVRQADEQSAGDGPILDSWTEYTPTGALDIVIHERRPATGGSANDGEPS